MTVIFSHKQIEQFEKMADILNKVNIKERGDKSMINVLSLDVEKIRNEISIKTMTNDKNPQYCIMSKDTLKLFKKFYQDETLTCNYVYKLGTVTDVICGLDIAICDNLKLGEVDIK